MFFVVIFSVSGQSLIETPNVLELSGDIKFNSKTNLELVDCIVNSFVAMGLTEYSETENELEPSFIKGNYSYSYYVDDYESEAGVINFKYLYEIKDGVLSYKFYQFDHDGSNTKFKSIGVLPEKWYEEIGKTFTEKQYIEIMKDIYANFVNTIRLIKKYCID